MFAVAAKSLLIAMLAMSGAASDGKLATSHGSGAKVKLAHTDYGRALANGDGYALYLFTRDERKRSRCYGKCADVWPPLLTHGKPVAGKRVHQRLLGTSKRRNGRRQVTYAGHPLYRYVGDRNPGQVLCQAANEYGGVWYVVRRSGEPIQ